LPIKAIEYALNKQEFTDVVCMRYGWKMKGIPTVHVRDKLCGSQPHMQTRWLKQILSSFMISTYSELSD